jgi:hypothetical protein
MWYENIRGKGGIIEFWLTDNGIFPCWLTTLDLLEAEVSMVVIPPHMAKQ